MADVFISYKQEERERMHPIAEALRALGVDIWFDARLEPGLSFTDEIQREIHACKAQLVCWSPLAAASEWVRGEADIGRQRRVLVPVIIEPCALPPPFNMLHAENLSDFSGQISHAGWLKTLGALSAKLERPGLVELWRLLSEGDAAAWKAWAEANPRDPFHDEAWSRYEALHLDAERDRLAQERAAARQRAEAEEARRTEQAARAEAERARLAAMRQQAEAETEIGRRAALDAAPEPVKTKSSLRTLLFFGGATLLATLAALIFLVIDRPSSPTSADLAPEAQAASPAQSIASLASPAEQPAKPNNAPVQSLSSAFAAALELKGYWNMDRESPICTEGGFPFGPVSDRTGEYIYSWAGEGWRRSRIIGQRDGWLEVIQLSYNGQETSEHTFYKLEGGRLNIRSSEFSGAVSLGRCDRPHDGMPSLGEMPS